MQDEKQPQIWWIYIGAGAKRNFELGRRVGTWGARVGGRFDGLRVGDYLNFVVAIRSDLLPKPTGFPKVVVEEFRGSVETVVKAMVTSTPFTDYLPIWPDSAYPNRIRFEVIDETFRVPFNICTQGRAVVQAVQRSCMRNGTPQLEAQVEAQEL